MTETKPRQFCRKCLDSVSDYDTLTWPGPARRLHFCRKPACQEEKAKYAK